MIFIIIFGKVIFTFNTLPDYNTNTQKKSFVLRLLYYFLFKGFSIVLGLVNTYVYITTKVVK